MSYSEPLADRIRGYLKHHDSYSERQMFGGLAMMLNGNMCCGVVGEELMARIGPSRYEAALKIPYVRQMDFTGKPLRGMVYIAAAGINTDDQLGSWIALSEQFALTLPPK